MVTWQHPYNGGSAITAYTVAFRLSDGVTFSPSLSECVANDATVLAEAKCVVPSAHFTEAPFNLEWGSNVFAKVTASNIRGDSP